MSTLPKTFYTPEEYLELERKAEFRSEYYNGQIFAMSGASRWHARIETQLAFLIEQHLTGKKCEAFPPAMRVLAQPSGLYTYPDLSVVCNEPQFTDPFGETLVNPTLLVEILSPSTENYDRGTKAKLYRAIPSLRELLIVSQDSYDVELYRRQTGDTWVLIEAKGLERCDRTRIHRLHSAASRTLRKGAGAQRRDRRGLALASQRIAGTFRWSFLPSQCSIWSQDAGAWKTVDAGYAVSKDRFNKVTFAPVTTSAIRLEVESQTIHHQTGQIGPPGANFLTRDIDWREFGIIEWRVK